MFIEIIHKMQAVKKIDFLKKVRVFMVGILFRTIFLPKGGIVLIV
jgi:hypothetical protein